MANAKSKRRRKILIFSVIILVLGGLTAAALLRKREAGDHRADREGRAPQPHRDWCVANGRIQPVVQVKISPEVSGEIIELPVKEGQRSRRATCW